MQQGLIPSFGPLAGVRVLSAGSIVAMPHAANMLADFGAEVIHIERPVYGDNYRSLAPFAQHDGRQVSTSWAQDARNRLSLTLELNLHLPDTAEIFYDLIRQSDIFMENLVWLEKYGISFSRLLEVNPRLVVVHVSGYGHPDFGGNPSTCQQASYDLIGQAYSGFLSLNGDLSTPHPIPSRPWTNDYISALHAVFGALSAYIHAQKTQEGQIVDVAQFEACARVLADTIVSYTEAGIVRGRSGAKSAAFQPYGLFAASDDAWIALGAFGQAVYERALHAMELDSRQYPFQSCAASVDGVASPDGRKLDSAIALWVSRHTAAEAVEIMAAARVPCSRVNTAADVVNDSHWQDRGDIVEYEDQTLKKPIRAVGIIPKMSRTPGQIWRGAPRLGQDTHQILSTRLGYSSEKIQRLIAEGII